MIIGGIVFAVGAYRKNTTLMWAGGLWAAGNVVLALYLHNRDRKVTA